MPCRTLIPVAACAALLTSACGGGAPAERTTAAPVADATVAAKTKGCGVSRAVASDGATVPRELRPGPAQVAALRASGSGFRARVVYARPLREVMNAIIAAAPAAGHQITFTEYEGTDGEVFLRRGSTATTLRLLAVRDCPTLSQAVVQAAG